MEGWYFKFLGHLGYIEVGSMGACFLNIGRANLFHVFLKECYAEIWNSPHLNVDFMQFCILSVKLSQHKVWMKQTPRALQPRSVHGSCMSRGCRSPPKAPTDTPPLKCSDTCSSSDITLHCSHEAWNLSCNVLFAYPECASVSPHKTCKNNFATAWIVTRQVILAVTSLSCDPCVSQCRPVTNLFFMP
jgi:hypothetical protein